MFVGMSWEGKKYSMSHLYPRGHPLVVVPHRYEPPLGRAGHQDDPEQKEADERPDHGFGAARHDHRHGGGLILFPPFFTDLHFFDMIFFSLGFSSIDMAIFHESQITDFFSGIHSRYVGTWYDTHVGKLPLIDDQRVHAH